MGSPGRSESWGWQKMPALAQLRQCMEWKKCCVHAETEIRGGSGFCLNSANRPSFYGVALDPSQKDSQFLSWSLVSGNKSSGDVFTM